MSTTRKAYIGRYREGSSKVLMQLLTYGKGGNKTFLAEVSCPSDQTTIMLTEEYLHGLALAHGIEEIRARKNNEELEEEREAWEDDG